MSELGQWLFQRERDTIVALLDKRAPTTGVVLTIAGTSVTYTDSVTGQAWPSAVPVIGQMPVVGERVIVLPLGDGSRVAFRMLANDPATIAVENSASGATTGSTTSTTTPQVALSVNLTLPVAGSTWNVLAIGSCSFITSVASSRANTQTRINGTLGALKTSPPLSTTVYCKGNNSDAIGVPGNQTIAVDFMYYAATAATITAQNAQILAIARRVA